MIHYNYTMVLFLSMPSHVLLIVQDNSTTWDGTDGIRKPTLVEWHYVPIYVFPTLKDCGLNKTYAKQESPFNVISIKYSINNINSPISNWFCNIQTWVLIGRISLHITINFTKFNKKNYIIKYSHTWYITFNKKKQ